MRTNSKQRISAYVFFVGALGIVGLIFAFSISAGARHARQLPNMPNWSERQIATILAARRQ